MKYKPDGRVPDISYLYEKNKLVKITRFSVEGRKTVAETFTKNGQRESLIIYSQKSSGLLKKIIFQKDGKTPKQEILFYEGTKDIKTVKTYTKTGELITTETFPKREY